MSYRILMLVPEGLTLDALSSEQQAAIASVLGQYVLPMIGTIPNAGRVVLDGVAADNFDASTIPLLGLPFEVIGQWKEDGTVIVPFDDEKFLAHLPDPEEGDKVLHEPHRWAGWPELF